MPGETPTGVLPAQRGSIPSPAPPRPAREAGAAPPPPAPHPRRTRTRTPLNESTPGGATAPGTG